MTFQNPPAHPPLGHGQQASPAVPASNFTAQPQLARFIPYAGLPIPACFSGKHGNPGGCAGRTASS